MISIKCWFSSDRLTYSSSFSLEENSRPTLPTRGSSRTRRPVSSPLSFAVTSTRYSLVMSSPDTDPPLKVSGPRFSPVPPKESCFIRPTMHQRITPGYRWWYWQVLAIGEDLPDHVTELRLRLNRPGTKGADNRPPMLPEGGNHLLGNCRGGASDQLVAFTGVG